MKDSEERFVLLPKYGVFQITEWWPPLGFGCYCRFVSKTSNIGPLERELLRYEDENHRKSWPVNMKEIPRKYENKIRLVKPSGTIISAYKGPFIIHYDYIFREDFSEDWSECYSEAIVHEGSKIRVSDVGIFRPDKGRKGLKLPWSGELSRDKAKHELILLLGDDLPYVAEYYLLRLANEVENIKNISVKDFVEMQGVIRRVLDKIETEPRIDEQDLKILNEAWSKQEEIEKGEIDAFDGFFYSHYHSLIGHLKKGSADPRFPILKVCEYEPCNKLFQRRLRTNQHAWEKRRFCSPEHQKRAADKRRKKRKP